MALKPTLKKNAVFILIFNFKAILLQPQNS